ncbi:MAG: hypothetical protein LC779_06760 [Actinobacteria bacterium]|nr:hypothetical protein [Actinomycetota bacterium]
MDRVDTEIVLPPDRGGTRCRVEIHPRSAEGRPVVILSGIEAWRGRAVAALVRGGLGVTTFMTVDLRCDRPTRSPVHPAWVADVRGMP